MNIFEVQAHVPLDSEGRLQEGVHGLHIVFGEVDEWEERYYMTVSLEDLDYSEGDAPHLKTEDLEKRLSNLNLESLKVGAGRLLYKELYPDFDPEAHTKFEEASYDMNRVFLKTRSLLVYHPVALIDHEHSKRDVTTEIKACEVLKRYPHPNVAKYLGCRVQANRITGIYYERYKTDIEDIPTPINVDKYISDMRKGIEHLHKLGYCHNDINPYNIKLTEDDTAVIIDFDSCLPLGEVLGKCGTPRFARETIVSEEENDWFGLERTERWMHEWNTNNNNNK